MIGLRGIMLASVLLCGAQSGFCAKGQSTPTAATSSAAIMTAAEVTSTRALFDEWKALDAPAERVSLPSERPIDSFRYTSPFGIRTDPFRGRPAMHEGVDLAAPTGTPIHATGDGIVSRAGPSTGYGNLVQIDHGASIQTRYGHLSRVLVAAGAHVHRGDVIGLVGSTGRSTGSHLHYEVRVAERAIDPLAFMAPGDERLALEQSVGTNAGARTAVGGPRAGD